ncbi:MAG: DUF2254 domain-containing protein [Phycisphaerae bacterium]|nr:DUF2254 domain-containing protein [Tepidisphaeraceae bacterium]
MTWLTRYRLRLYMRRSAWLFPTAMIPAALVAAPVVRYLDHVLQWDGLGYTPDGARALLGAIVPATLTMVVLILSMLLLSIQLAASQLSPRLIRGLIARRPVRACLAIFVFSYVYASAALGRIGSDVPQIGTLVAIVLTLVSVGAGIFLVDYLARELRPVQMLARTATIGRMIIDEVYPRFSTPTARPSAGEQGAVSLDPPSETLVRTRPAGVLMAMDIVGLTRLAEESGGAIEIIPQVGDFLPTGAPLFRVSGGARSIPADRLYESVAFGDERTPEQDPTFVFRILVDVATKALSPAINDPTTAVLAIDQIHYLLRQVGMRRLDTGQVRDGEGTLRVLYRTPGWNDFVVLAVIEVRQYGVTSIQVARRMRAMLDDLIQAVPPERRPILEEQKRLLDTGIVRNFSDAEDRTRATTGDLQGVGGAPTEGSRSGDATAA